MCTKHTPGPWKFGKRTGDFQYIDGRNWLELARLPVKVSGSPDTAGMANALLGAAAPELLAACGAAGLWLAEEAKEGVVPNAILRALRTAISKAGGAT